VFSPDGKALAFQAPQAAPMGPGVPAGPAPAIEVFDTVTGKHVGSLPSDSDGTAAVPVAFSPDRRCLALAKRDGTVALHELATRQPRRIYGTKLDKPEPKNDPMVNIFPGMMPALRSRPSAAISPDGKLLALSGRDGAIHIYDILTGLELRVFK